MLAYFFGEVLHCVDMVQRAGYEYGRYCAELTHDSREIVDTHSAVS